MTVLLTLATAGCGDSGTAPTGGTPPVPSDVCGRIERLQPDDLLGGAAASHRACTPDAAMGTIGAAVWTAPDGIRVSVSVVDGTAKDGAAPFDQLYTTAPAAQRLTLTGGIRYIDKTSTAATETGTLIVDRAATYLVVWMSDERGQQTGIDIPTARRPAFLRFASAAVQTIYDVTVRFPDAPAASPTAAAPSSSAAAPAAADGVAAELGKLGYQRSMTGGYQSPTLGRKVTIEDWTSAAPASPTVQLSDAPPGTPGTLAIADIDWGPTGQYDRFLCEPDDAHAFKVAWTIDQSNIVRQNFSNGVIRPQPGPSGTATLSGNTVTCTLT